MTDTARGRKKGWLDPLSRPIVAATVPATGIDVVVEPDAAEREAMARALNLNDISRLRAEYRLARRSGGAIQIDGRVTGVVRPTCIVSLEPFELKINEPVDLRFAEAIDEREGREGREKHADIAAIEGDDPPDTIENGMIDLGRVTTEFLSLAVPAFPRKPGVDFEQPDEAAVESPFAALAGLKPPKTP